MQLPRRKDLPTVPELVIALGSNPGSFTPRSEFLLFLPQNYTDRLRVEGGGREEGKEEGREAGSLPGLASRSVGDPLTGSSVQAAQRPEPGVVNRSQYLPCTL